MKKIIPIISVMLAATPALADGLCLFECSSSVPTSRNTAFVQASGQGLLFAYGTEDNLLQQAARTTLERGFSRFIIQGMQTGVGAAPVGYQRYGYGYGNIYTRRAGQSSAQITMFRSGDAGYENAMDARSILQSGD